MNRAPARASTQFRMLLVGFAGQIAGRLVDLRWHATHEEFEGGAEQLQAHWLIWIATLFVIVVAAGATRHEVARATKSAYLVVLGANLAYAVVAVIHFFQHLNHLEVDWTHLLLAVTNVAGAVGVIWAIVAYIGAKRDVAATA